MSFRRGGAELIANPARGYLESGTLCWYRMSVALLLAGQRDDIRDELPELLHACAAVGMAMIETICPWRASIGFQRQESPVRSGRVPEGAGSIR